MYRALGNKKIVILILAFLMVIFFAHHNSGKQRSFSLLEKKLIDIISPVQKVANNVSKTIAKPVRTVVKLYKLEKENEKIKKRLEILEEKKVRLAELEAENNRLRKLLDFQQRDNFTLEPAEIIARDASNWFKIIVLNKGKEAGIDVDMPVVTHAGLVGKVVAVTENTSRVRLILDPEVSVGGIFQRTRQIGIVQGQIDETEFVQVRLLEQDSTIKKGDIIITSGMGGIFPKGIVIGRVVKMESGDIGINQYARIRPAVNFNRLEEVLIIKGIKKYIY